MTDIPEKMKGVWLTGHGGPEVLEFREDIPVPAVGAGDVLIKVAAAGVNNTDINTRLAWYSKANASGEDASWTGEPIGFPRIQGIDACGRIVACGHDVSQDRLGARVLVEPCLREFGGELKNPPWFLGSECDGGFAEYLAVPARHAVTVQCDLSDAELASFPCSYSTAENMLTRARVAAGDRVLVTGASGGVGSAAVQLARARGADVIAVTGEAKRQQLLDLGAAQTITRTDVPADVLGENSIDVVVDLVAGDGFPALLDVLKPGGCYAVSGAIAGPLVELDVRTLYLKDLSFFGCTALEDGVFANLAAHIEAGRIRPLVAATFPLKDISRAQEVFLEKSHVGKIVLTVS